MSKIATLKFGSAAQPQEKNVLWEGKKKGIQGTDSMKELLKT